MRPGSESEPDSNSEPAARGRGRDRPSRRLSLGAAGDPGGRRARPGRRPGANPGPGPRGDLGGGRIAGRSAPEGVSRRRGRRTGRTIAGGGGRDLIAGVGGTRGARMRREMDARWMRDGCEMDARWMRDGSVFPPEKRTLHPFMSSAGFVMHTVSKSIFVLLLLLVLLEYRYSITNYERTRVV